jgi:hypothetical protein
MSISKKILISGFILFNFLIMIRVHMPVDKTFFTYLYKPVDTYLSFFSNYQDWLMFAPNPNRMNTKLSAIIEFDDGTKTKYQFPDSSEMSLGQKYMGGERFRKLISEGITRDRNKFMWKDTSKFILRMVRDENLGKIPLRVHLIRHWNEIPDVDRKFIPHKQAAKEFNSFTFYTHEVI